MNYCKHYEALMCRAKTRSVPKGYVEMHHIAPRCLGGSDDMSNLVALTAEEHYVAHQLLAKMYPDSLDLAYAAYGMTISNVNRRTTNKLFGWLRVRRNKAISFYMKNRSKEQTSCYGKFGDKHPRWGTGKHQKVEGYTRPTIVKRGTKEHFDKMSSIRKVIFSGEQNPSYGKICINDGVVTKRIPKDQSIPEGWVLGMVKRKQRMENQ